MKISEIYETFQGEGKSLGKPVVFLRTALCNLACIWCDTPYTWNWKGTKFKHPEKYQQGREVMQMSVRDISYELNSRFKTRNLVISGGEPLLQQRELVELMQILKPLGWWIEVETNGTITPTDSFINLVDQINCSPKLINSGPDNHLYKRIVPDVLKKLSSSTKTNFKFVVQDLDDMTEILKLINTYKMSQVYLMPEGRTKIDQENRQKDIQAICIAHGYNFSPRLHILMFDDKRGV
jgi:organic radical activating enzyme